MTCTKKIVHCHHTSTLTFNIEDLKSTYTKKSYKITIRYYRSRLGMQALVTPRGGQAKKPTIRNSAMVQENQNTHLHVEKNRDSGIIIVARSI